MTEQKKLEIIVFAGPNGSGKSTITEAAHIIQPYINADEIKKALGCSDQEAAEIADQRRIECIEQKTDFTFETVLSTERKLDLLQDAKSKGYFIRGYFVLTCNAEINVFRVHARVQNGGHGVPDEKIRSRYTKSLLNLPRFIDLCDVCHVYDNTREPFRIFKKRKSEYFVWENEFWTKAHIAEVTHKRENSAV